MARLNVVAAVERARKEIERSYNIALLDANDLRENYEDGLELIYAAFLLGYSRGQKAAKAQFKKSRKAGGGNAISIN